MCVNNSTINDSEGKEDHKRQNLNYIRKWLNSDEQTLSRCMNVKGTVGESARGNEKYNIRN